MTRAALGYTARDALAASQAGRQLTYRPTGLRTELAIATTAFSRILRCNFGQFRQNAGSIKEK